MGFFHDLITDIEGRTRDRDSSTALLEVEFNAGAASFGRLQMQPWADRVGVGDIETYVFSATMPEDFPNGGWLGLRKVPLPEIENRKVLLGAELSVGRQKALGLYDTFACHGVEWSEGNLLFGVRGCKKGDSLLLTVRFAR